MNFLDKRRMRPKGSSLSANGFGQDEWSHDLPEKARSLLELQAGTPAMFHEKYNAVGNEQAYLQWYLNNHSVQPSSLDAAVLSWTEHLQVQEEMPSDDEDDAGQSLVRSGVGIRREYPRSGTNYLAEKTMKRSKGHTPSRHASQDFPLSKRGAELYRMLSRSIKPSLLGDNERFTSLRRRAETYLGSLQRQDSLALREERLAYQLAELIVATENTLASSNGTTKADVARANLLFLEQIIQEYIPGVKHVITTGLLAADVKEEQRYTLHTGDNRAALSAYTEANAYRQPPLFMRPRHPERAHSINGQPPLRQNQVPKEPGNTYRSPFLSPRPNLKAI